MSTALALMERDHALHDANNRFNALAAVAGSEIARFIKPAVVMPLTIAVSALGSAVATRWDTKGLIGSAVVGAIAYGVGIMAKDNADLRWGAYAIGMGLGTAAASIGVHDWMINRMAATVAPTPVAAPAPAMAA